MSLVFAIQYSEQMTNNMFHRNLILIKLSVNHTYMVLYVFKLKIKIYFCFFFYSTHSSFSLSFSSHNKQNKTIWVFKANESGSCWCSCQGNLRNFHINFLGHTGNSKSLFWNSRILEVTVIKLYLIIVNKKVLLRYNLIVKMIMQCIGYYPLLVLQYSRGMDAQGQETWQEICHAAHDRRNISGKKSISRSHCKQFTSWKM